MRDHSHTILDDQLKENIILITQAGMGTDHLRRFDLIIDEGTTRIVDFSGTLLKFQKTARPEVKLLEYIHGYKGEIDRKYNALVTKFVHLSPIPP